MSRSGTWARRGAAALAVLAIGLTAADAITRQLTRARLVGWLPDDPVALAVVPLAALLVWAAAWRWIGTRGEAIRSRAGARGNVTAAILTALFASGLAWQLALGARLQSDGFYYFAYLRSLAFDRDVNFMNDYRLLGLGDKRNLFEPTITGHAHSAWTIGPAIVWAPFFAVGHAAATSLQARGADVATNGTSYPYRQAICIAGLFYALLGAWFSTRAVRLVAAARDAGAAVAAVLGGSFLLWYALAEPSMTHAPSMAAVAGFVWYWLATRDRRSLAHWIGLGAVAGFATLVRWQNALFAVLPAIDAGVVLWRAARAGDRRAVVEAITGGTAFTAAATAAFLPQLLAWKAIYGHYLAVSPVGPAIYWSHPQWVAILWSSRNGLFAMSPVLYVAAIGLLLVAWRKPDLGVPALVAVALMTYFNACIQDWWGSAGFGGRRFDGVLPLFAIGMAAAIEAGRRVTAAHPRAVAALVLAAAVTWNLTLYAASTAGAIAPAGAPRSFGDVAAAQASTLHAWIGHPFSYPANLIFAARNGMPPSAYDLIAPLSFLGDPLRPYGRLDLGTVDPVFLLDGWHDPERDGDVTFRWATRDAGVIVPLNFADDLDLQIRLRGNARPDVPAAAVTIDTGRARFGPFPVPPDWQTLVVSTPRSAWRAGVNRLRFAFAETTGRPDGANADGDDRAAAVAYVRVQIRVGSAPR